MFTEKLNKDWKIQLEWWSWGDSARHPFDGLCTLPTPGHSPWSEVLTLTPNPYPPCYSVSHTVQHLFGNHCVDMNFMMTHENPAESKKASFTGDLSNLETELKDYVTKQEGQQRLCFLEFLGYHDPYHPQSQATETDFSNAGSMIECGLFTEVLCSQVCCRQCHTCALS